jgi:hypothetical protein
VCHGPNGRRDTFSSPRTDTGLRLHRRYARTIVGLRATSGTECPRDCTSWVTSTPSSNTNGRFDQLRASDGPVTAAPSSSASTWSTRASASPMEVSGSSTGATRATASSTACASASSSRRLSACWMFGIVRPMV